MTCIASYKTTVNESETITAAQANDRYLAPEVNPSNGAARGPVRKCRPAIRAWSGDPARSEFPDPRAFLSVPDRPLWRRQDVLAAPLVPVAAADAWSRQSVR